MRSIIRSGVALATLSIATLSSTLCVAAANNLLINATADTNNINGTIGYQFAADAEIDYPRIAKALGFIDAGGDGLASSHQVGLYRWNGSAYNLERSVTIGSGTAYYLDGGYRWYPIADYALTDTGATAYFLAATVVSGDGDLWGGAGSADFTSIGNSTYNVNPAATGGSLTSSVLPATWNGSFPGGTFYNAANLTINPAVPLPEPSTYAMALAGVACGGYSMWRRRKRVSLTGPFKGDSRRRLVTTCLTLFAVLLAVGSRDAVGSEIYLTSYFNGNVGKFAADGTPINTNLITGLSNPSGIKLGPDGFLYVANRGSGNVGRYSTTGSGNATFLTGLSAPFGIAFDGLGDMYIASYQSSNSVRKYSANGTPLNMTYITGLPKAEGLAFDPAGNLYVSDFQLGTVSKYGPTGSLINANFITGLSGPTALAIDADYNLFVSQYSTGRVGKYTASTSSFNSSFISGYAEPEGIVLNADGSILVASLAGGKVQKYDASGALVNANFITGVGSAYAMTGPSLFTPTPVPEPSTYAMALAGVACGGYSMWRRRKRA